MDFDQYVAARRSRLVEDAVADGVAPEDAEGLVDFVLEWHRRDIIKSDDPHPQLREAVGRAARGEAVENGGRNPLLLLPVAALALIGVFVLVVSFVGNGDSKNDTTPTPRPTPTAPSPSSDPLPITTMPLLLGYDATTAQQRLRELGFTAEEHPTASCAPAGLVLGSRPAYGTPLDAGDSVVLMTAQPSTAGPVRCDPSDRVRLAQGWAFVRYVIGRGAAPRFASSVTITIDDGSPLTIAGRAAGRDSLDGLGQYFGQFTGLGGVTVDGRYPELTALTDTPATLRCGVQRPAAFGDRHALEVSLESYTLGDDDVCAPLIDLYSRSGAIDGIALYREPVDGSHLPGDPSLQPEAPTD